MNEYLIKYKQIINFVFIAFIFPFKYIYSFLLPAPPHFYCAPRSLVIAV